MYKYNCDLMGFPSLKDIKELRKKHMKLEAFEHKVWLATPTMHGQQMQYVQQAYETNWMSTVGENINEV